MPYDRAGGTDRLVGWVGGTSLARSASPPQPADGPIGPRRLSVRRLGVLAYEEALALQRSLVDERRAGRIGDTLLLLQHPHVITVGVRGDGGRSHILASPETLAARGVPICEAGRGGDVTYHGPGQLVGYPILDLNPDRRDVHRYVRDLEEALIRTAADYGIGAERVDGLTGVWVGREKLAAIGVRIARWITSHGFALNVSTDLDYFDLIVPCGIADRGVTSLERLLGRPVELADVEGHFVEHFNNVFQFSSLKT
jgi:lipoyl(octanoyl) transferase